MSGIQASFRLPRGSFLLDAAFDVPSTGITAVFGPSGSGKTTLLRCVAGLERPPSGSLRSNGDTWQDEQRFVPPHRRAIGYVPQESTLFPHLSVRDNVAFGHRRVPAGERRVSLDAVIEQLALGPLLDRRPPTLSGGERQRVALGRALAASPRLLLMDEPLASLDEASRREVLPLIEGVHREHAIPILYVSHSLREVSRLADHVVWLSEGRVRASGPLDTMLARLDLWHDVDESAVSVLTATVAEQDATYELTGVDTVCGRLWMPRLDRPVGAAVRVRILARDVSLSLEPEHKSSILNSFPARVDEVTDAAPGQILLRLGCGPGFEEARLLARITRRSRAELGLDPGVEVYARVKSVSLAD